MKSTGKNISYQQGLGLDKRRLRLDCVPDINDPSIWEFRDGVTHLKQQYLFRAFREVRIIRNRYADEWIEYPQVTGKDLLGKDVVYQEARTELVRAAHDTYRAVVESHGGMRRTGRPHEGSGGIAKAKQDALDMSQSVIIAETMGIIVAPHEQEIVTGRNRPERKTSGTRRKTLSQQA